jgi:dTMP kinase
MNRADADPVFIVFEGLDGSGKTICARHLAERMGAELITTPSSCVRRFRNELIDSFSGCEEAAQLFYLATVFHASEQVRRHMAAGRSVVMDRYFLSTQVYADFRGAKLELDELQSHLAPASLTVFLDAPPTVRAERLAERASDFSDSETLQEAADKRLRQLYTDKAGLAIAGKWLELDSASLPVTAIGEAILHAMGRHD